jgi:hypothetical protein
MPCCALDFTSVSKGHSLSMRLLSLLAEMPKSVGYLAPPSHRFTQSSIVMREQHVMHCALAHRMVVICVAC